MWPRFEIILTKITTLEYTPRYSRLAGELSSYKPQLEKRIIDSNTPNSQWSIQAKELISDSEKYLKENKIDEAWKSFHAAKRMVVYAMSDDERMAHAKSLFRETGKLNEWRRESIISLLGKRPDGVTVPPAVEYQWRWIN